MKNISIFYDGQHLKLALAYYHDTFRKTIDLSALHRFIGRKADGRVISARAYYGRSSPERLDERHLRDDRFFDTLLAKAGILPHVLPVNSLGAEKGVDVWLVLDLFEYVTSTQCDVAVLVSGDADYVPLLRKLKITETKSMVLGWNLPDTTNVAQALLQKRIKPLRWRKS